MTSDFPDLFRDTNVRYLGYANEVGESFRAIIPTKLVRITYGIAFAYVLADTADKSWKSYKKRGTENLGREAGDALLWQTLASVIIPGFTINRICAFTNKNLARYVPKLPLDVRRGITVAVGLAFIPVIIHPIDLGVDALMDVTYRKWYKGQRLLREKECWCPALDPAGPLWNLNSNSLSSSDAVYMDGGYSIGGLGIGSFIDRAKFFPNGGNLEFDHIYNHNRAGRFYTATVTTTWS